MIVSVAFTETEIMHRVKKKPITAEREIISS